MSSPDKTASKASITPPQAKFVRFALNLGHSACARAIRTAVVRSGAALARYWVASIPVLAWPLRCVHYAELQKNDPTAAASNLREAIEWRAKAAKLDPSNNQWQLELAFAQIDFGRVQDEASFAERREQIETAVAMLKVYQAEGRKPELPGGAIASAEEVLTTLPPQRIGIHSE